MKPTGVEPHFEVLAAVRALDFNTGQGETRGRVWGQGLVHATAHCPAVALT